MHSKRSRNEIRFRARLVLVAFLLFAHHRETFGHSYAAGFSSCLDHMEPKKEEHTGHGSDIAPQTAKNPYILTLDKKKVSGGDKIMMTISGPYFKGFLILVRKKNDLTAYGNWEDGGDGNTRTVDCTKADVKGVGATHEDNNPKQSVSVVWVAPNKHAKYSVYFTVVQDKKIYWSKQQTKGHSNISVKKIPRAGSSSLLGSWTTSAILPMIILIYLRVIF